MVPEQRTRQAGLETYRSMGMISGKTALVGLLGQPVRHSLSPVIHNAALAEMKLDWCYLALPCETKNLKNVLRALRALDCRGLNITIPHKQNVAKICTQLQPLAKQLGAVNTLLPNKNGGWTGSNTDVEGFLAPLKESKKEWQRLKATILGCGGSARAVVAGLQELKPAQIIVVGRRESALQSFLTDLKKTWGKSGSIEPSFNLKGCLQTDPNLVKELRTTDLVVNTTPVGMGVLPKKESTSIEMPLGEEIWKNLEANTILYDLIYTPRPTAWLQWGADHGYQCIDGLEMLIQQGAASLRVWSGKKEIPINLMRKAAQSFLTI